MGKQSTKGRLKTTIDKDMLKYLIPKQTSNTDAAKTFNVCRNMVAWWINENELANVFEEPTYAMVNVDPLFF